MPTRYSAQAYTPAPRWLTTWETMYRELEPRAVEILRESGFYETNDISVPVMVVGGKLSKEEGTAIGRIATALTIAADAAHQTSPGLSRPGCRKLPRIPHYFGPSSCHPTCIGRSHHVIAAPTSGRVRICKMFGVDGASVLKPRPGARPIGILRERRVWLRHRCGAPAAVLEISQMNFWPNTLPTPSAPLAGVSCAARFPSTWTEVGFSTRTMDRSTNSSKR
jgi:hypothetical protein